MWSPGKYNVTCKLQLFAQKISCFGLFSPDFQGLIISWTLLVGSDHMRRVTLETKSGLKSRSTPPPKKSRGTVSTLAICRHGKPPGTRQLSNRNHPKQPLTANDIAINSAYHRKLWRKMKHATNFSTSFCKRTGRIQKSSCAWLAK
jgi:hypothetical protein